MEFRIDLFVFYFLIIKTKSYHYVELNVTNCWNYEHYENFNLY
jgi:hypothetical protein